MSMINSKHPFLNKHGITVLLSLILSAMRSMAQDEIKGGMETPSGFLEISHYGLANKKNLTVNERDVIRVLSKQNRYGDINVFLLNAHQKDTIGLNYGEFGRPSNADNTFRKVSDSLYEIYINDPGKPVLFAYRKNKAFGVGSIGALSGGFNAPNLMGERIDTFKIEEGQQLERFNVLPYNPFLYGLELVIWDKTSSNPYHKLVAFKILFQFPPPKLIGIRTDSVIINKKSANPSLRYHDAIDFDKSTASSGLRNREAAKWDVKNAKPVFRKSESSIFFAFEHFGGVYRNDYFDNLQYRFDNQRNWVLTSLAYNPSILLEKIAAGKHRLQVRYPVEGAPIYVYDFEVLPDWRDSPIWPISGGIAVTALVLFFVFRARLKRAEERAKKNRLELQAIQSQLNPHFMFNALGSIQYLVHDNKESADLYLTEFSNLLRHSLYNSEKEMVPVSVELQTLGSYIRLEQLRFGFRYEQLLDERIAPENINIPALLIQPLIENAIKHGMASLQDQGLLQMNIYPNEKDLVIEITDNGSGFSETPSGKGLGLKLVKERIELLKRQGMHILLSFTDNRVDKTMARVVFKEWL